MSLTKDLNSCAPEGLVLPDPLVAPFVILTGNRNDYYHYNGSHEQYMWLTRDFFLDEVHVYWLQKSSYYTSLSG